jgi:hypothetical protein
MKVLSFHGDGFSWELKKLNCGFIKMLRPRTM